MYYRKEYAAAMTNPEKKRVPNELERKECAALNSIYKAKKKALGLTQEQIAIEGLGANTQSAASHYLTGRNALNVEAAIVFSRYLQEPIEAFSPRLAKELAAMAQAAGIGSDKGEGGAPETLATVDEVQGLLGQLRSAKSKASPKSQAVISRMIGLAERGEIDDSAWTVINELLTELCRK